MQKQHLFIAILLAFTTAANAQSAHSLLRNGDADYKTGDFQLAEENYRKALEKERSSEGTYNLGNSIYRQERIEEAARQYLKAAEDAKDERTKAQAYHNLGNSLYQMQDYENSINAFKSALRHSPEDLETKYNLAQAQRQYRIQQQQQQQQQQENQDQESDEQQEQDPQQQQNQDQQQQDQQQQQQSESESESQEQENQDQQPQPQEGQEQDITREEAEQLLKIMEQEEQKVQEKLRKGGDKKKPEKDW